MDTFLRSVFYSSEIQNDEEILEVSRYIHRNPLEANTVETLENYRWSSYSSYVNSQHIPLIYVTKA